MLLCIIHILWLSYVCVCILFYRIIFYLEFKEVKGFSLPLSFIMLLLPLIAFNTIHVFVCFVVASRAHCTAASENTER